MDTTDAAIEYGGRVLNGDLVQLRELRESDLEQLVRWWNEPEPKPLLSLTVQPKPAAAVREMYQEWSANDSDSSAGFSVVDRESGSLVGHVAIFGIDTRVRAGTLGVVIGGDQTGRGYGTDAVRVIVNYGFEELNLNRIELRVFAYNSRAIATYRKVGFVEEGRRRQVTFHGGKYYDDVIMSLLAEEYRAG